MRLIRAKDYNDVSRKAANIIACAAGAGADRAEVYETDGNPVTYGEKIIDPDTGEVLDSTEERVLIVQIATIRPRFAIAVPVLNGGDIKKVKRGMIVRKLDPNVPSAHDYVPGNSGVVRQFEQQPQSSPQKKRTLIRN